MHVSHQNGGTQTLHVVHQNGRIQILITLGFIIVKQSRDSMIFMYLTLEFILLSYQ